MTIVIPGAFPEFHISLCGVLKEITTRIKMNRCTKEEITENHKNLCKDTKIVYNIRI